MTYNNNNEIRNLMNADLENLHFNKHKRQEERENTYKYGNDNKQEVVSGEIPQWARDALTTYKPGDTVGQYSQDDLRNKRNE